MDAPPAEPRVTRRIRGAMPRLLAISDGDGGPTRLERWSVELAAAGVPALQLREKTMTDRSLLVAARRVRSAAPELLLLLHRRFDLALAGGADGVHLAADGLPTRLVREQVEPEFWIGRSTHTIEELAAARDEGADYAVFGPVFASPGKGPAVGLAALRRAVAAAEPLPVLALGGVGPDELAMVRDCGAWGAAGIRAFATGGAARAMVERTAA